MLLQRPHVGDGYRVLHTKVVATSTGEPTIGPAVVAAQCSGSGKTKLAFSVSMECVPIVVTRVGVESGLTKTWAAVEALLGNETVTTGSC